MQKIKLLTPLSDFECVELERDPNWFREDAGDMLGGNDAVLRSVEMQGGETETLADLQLELFVIVYSDSDPVSWYFCLKHESFGNVPIYEWECDVPDESLPEVQIQCNETREFNARWADRKAATTEEDEDDEDDADSWKNA